MSFATTVTIVRGKPFPVLLSSEHISHPGSDLVSISEEIFEQYDVGTILNVSSGTHATTDHLRLYHKHGIFYHDHPIDDTTAIPVPTDFAQHVLAVYDAHAKRSPTKAILVNCSMGVNRSALAAAIMLWNRTPLKLWESPPALISDMRDKQAFCRGIVLLQNPSFVDYLQQTLTS